MTRNQYKRKRIEQRLMGLGLLACVVLVSILDDNWTSAVMFGPLALWMVFTREIVIY